MGRKVIYYWAWGRVDWVCTRLDLTLFDLRGAGGGVGGGHVWLAAELELLSSLFFAAFLSAFKSNSNEWGSEPSNVISCIEL